MTEHEHMPPIRLYTTRWLTKDRILLHMPGCEYVIRKEDARKLLEEIKTTLHTPEPSE